MVAILSAFQKFLLVRSSSGHFLLLSLPALSTLDLDSVRDCTLTMPQLENKRGIARLPARGIRILAVGMTWQAMLCLCTPYEARACQAKVYIPGWDSASV